MRDIVDEYRPVDDWPRDKCKHCGSTVHLSQYCAKRKVDPLEHARGLLNQYATYAGRFNGVASMIARTDPGNTRRIADLVQQLLEVHVDYEKEMIYGGNDAKRG